MIASIDCERGISDTRNWLIQIMLFPSKYHRLLYSMRLYSNPYSNAGELQHKYTTHDGQIRADSSTGKTRTNTSEQLMSSPPFGMPSIYYEPHQTSSKATSGFRSFQRSLCTATAATVVLATYDIRQTN